MKAWNQDTFVEERQLGMEVLRVRDSQEFQRKSFYMSEFGAPLYSMKPLFGIAGAYLFTQFTLSIFCAVKDPAGTIL